MRAVSFLLLCWFGLLFLKTEVAGASSLKPEVDIPGTIDEFLNDHPTTTAEEDHDDRNLLLGLDFGLFNNNNQDDSQEDEPPPPPPPPALLGERCGGGLLGLGDDDNCLEGLECSHFSPGIRPRCTPRNDCVLESIGNILNRPQFTQGGRDTYKNKILQLANVTERDVMDAVIAANLNRQEEDLAAFVASQPIQAIRKAIDKTVKDDFADLGPMMKRCVEPEEHGRDLQQDDVDEDGSDPNQGDGHFPVVFIGVHIEAGALLDASFSTVWQVIGGSVTVTERVAGRICGGVEIGAGFELSFIAAVGFTADVNTLNCLQVLIDADVEVFVGIGLGYGFCVENGSPATNEMYVEFTIGVGVGGGIGASICQVYPFV